MGRITERLRRDFRAVLKRKIVPIEAIHRGEENAASIQSVDDLIENGRHPLHAVYTNAANLINLFVEQFVDLPGFHRQYKFLLKAQDYRHMKRGKDDWYWTEFLFCGYVNHRSDAIFLTGFPDRPETQPHHDAFDERHSRTFA